MEKHKHPAWGRPEMSPMSVQKEPSMTDSSYRIQAGTLTINEYIYIIHVHIMFSAHRKKCSTKPYWVCLPTFLIDVALRRVGVFGFDNYLLFSVQHTKTFHLPSHLNPILGA